MQVTLNQTLILTLTIQYVCIHNLHNFFLLIMHAFPLLNHFKARGFLNFLSKVNWLLFTV